jgi:hypothetical protein
MVAEARPVVKEEVVGIQAALAVRAAALAVRAAALAVLAAAPVA